MDMEVVEETMGCSNDQGHVVKGKRTKRPRPTSPFYVAMASTSSSSIGAGSGGDGGAGQDERSSSSPTTSAEFASESTEEEEDMANCLILLAQGHNGYNSKKLEEISGSTRAMETTSTKAGLYVYECRTCNRCFPSFQALGGHRASHKRPRTTMQVIGQEHHHLLHQKSTGDNLGLQELDDHHQSQMMITTSPPDHHNLPPHQMGNRAAANYNSNNRSKIHECSICGSEFSSGQALGGHMRRHRTSSSSSSSCTTTAGTSIINTTTAIANTAAMIDEKPIKSRNVLALDLNLPAPEDDRESKFSFASKQQPLVFSASALVGCHY